MNEISTQPLVGDLLNYDPWLDMKTGRLRVGGEDANALAEKFGTPLFVVIESALRENYRKLKSALVKAWPVETEIFYSVKSNPNLRVTKCFVECGAGIDVFSGNELRAGLLAAGGKAPVVLNGSAKELSALRLTVEVGGTINIDSIEEIDVLESISASRRLPIDVNIRLKPTAQFFSAVASDYFGVGAGDAMINFIDDEKWGFSTEGTVGLVKRLSASQAFRLRGYSSHIGRVSVDPEVFKIYGQSLADMATVVHKATGFLPSVLDAGGGWPRYRDPESRSYHLNDHKIDDYTEAFARGFLDGWVGKQPPTLWIEPGRFLVGNAVVLLTEVVSRKADLNRIWITVDTSTNHLARIDTSRSRYFIIPTTDQRNSPEERVEIVGPTCVHSVLASDYLMPRTDVGALLAVLDVGMYAESTSNNFNLMPRPACVYIGDGTTKAIRRAETFEDILRTQLELWKD